MAYRSPRSSRLRVTGLLIISARALTGLIRYHLHGQGPLFSVVIKVTTSQPLDIMFRKA